MTFEKLAEANKNIKVLNDKVDNINYKLDISTEDRVVKCKSIENKQNYYEVNGIKCCQTSTNLCNRIKKKLKNNLISYYSRFNLKNINEKDFFR